MVKVNETDRWSLIALGNNRAKSVELKFVDLMKRKYEFRKKDKQLSNFVYVNLTIFSKTYIQGVH